MARVLQSLVVLLTQFQIAQSACTAISDVRYCYWNQVYTYYPEVEMADWVSVDSSALCGRCSPGSHYTSRCGSPNAERWDGCAACWPGSFSLGGDRPTCLPCAAGSYAPNYQSTACQLCPIGNYTSETGKSSCLSCPPGTSSNSTGADKSNLCVGPAVRSFVETVAVMSGIADAWS
jgi:hypothetical protein